MPTTPRTRTMKATLFLYRKEKNKLRKRKFSRKRRKVLKRLLRKIVLILMNRNQTKGMRSEIRRVLLKKFIISTAGTLDLNHLIIFVFKNNKGKWPIYITRTLIG